MDPDISPLVARFQQSKDPFEKSDTLAEIREGSADYSEPSALATLCGVSTPLINRYLSLQQLHAEVRELAVTKVLAMGTAYALAKVPTYLQCAFAQQIIEQKMPVERAVVYMERALAEHQTSTLSNSGWEPAHRLDNKVRRLPTTESRMGLENDPLASIRVFSKDLAAFIAGLDRANLSLWREAIACDPSPTEVITFLEIAGTKFKAIAELLKCNTS